MYEATPETYLDDSSISRTLYPLVMRGIRHRQRRGAYRDWQRCEATPGAGARSS
ncbi:MAG: hypothetical protein V9G20_19780 [Candidatus Promineifilaceae bacterium]